MLFTLLEFLFAPAGIAKEFNVDKSGIFIIRYLGCFAFSALLVGLWILFRPMGPIGTWPYYNLFSYCSFNLIYDFLIILKSLTKILEQKNSRLDFSCIYIFNSWLEYLF